jgi:hypothetical protein
LPGCTGRLLACPPRSKSSIRTLGGRTATGPRRAGARRGPLLCPLPAAFVGVLSNPIRRTDRAPLSPPPCRGPPLKVRSPYGASKGHRPEAFLPAGGVGPIAPGQTMGVGSGASPTSLGARPWTEETGFDAQRAEPSIGNVTALRSSKMMAWSIRAVSRLRLALRWCGHAQAAVATWRWTRRRRTR